MGIEVTLPPLPRESRANVRARPHPAGAIRHEVLTAPHPHQLSDHLQHVPRGQISAHASGNLNTRDGFLSGAVGVRFAGRTVI